MNLHIVVFGCLQLWQILECTISFKYFSFSFFHCLLFSLVQILAFFSVFLSYTCCKSCVGHNTQNHFGANPAFAS
ncbi:Uncharacterized protein TCM_017496 [Theobroma cacao]|uniref:Uncharacterized protein n=1 Tax=Theobroma cacao TaxID=3641 RepID=A0A061EF94_THECC|nr:Uncharacterized protein TCM_017496 [Theobroma cacao]